MDTMEFERRCWAEVDLGALRHNFKLVRERAGDAAVMAVVKADAYGHGDAVVAPLLEQEGADQFAVSGFGEAVCLRRAGVTKPILILGYTGVQNAAALAVGGISQTVFSLEYARALSEAALRAGVAVRVHLKVDTGMGRIGFTADDDMERAVAEMAEACALPGLCPWVSLRISQRRTAPRRRISPIRAASTIFCARQWRRWPPGAVPLR